MADIATAIISGSFAVASSLGSVWLKDYLEQRRQVRVSQPAPSDRTAARSPPAIYGAAVPGSRLRPLFIALIGFAASAASDLLRSGFSNKPWYGSEMVACCILLLVVLFSIFH